MGISSVFAIAVLCLAAAFLALWLFSSFENRALPHHAQLDETVDYLFDGEEIIHCTAQADRILHELGQNRDRTWHLLFRAFSSRFPGLPQTAKEAYALSGTRIEAVDPSDKACLILEKVHGQLRVGLEDPEAATAADRHLRIRQLQFLADVGLVTNLFPYPVWLRTEKGELEWGNKAYFELAEGVETSEDDRAIPVFDIDLPDGEASRTERLMVEDRSSKQTGWFNVTKTNTDRGATFGFAIGIDAVIEAEVAQRKFVQTLTKTFAQLSTGLAIFDRERQLALFNPALVDLLALPADFLSARPTLLTFFDKLRDNRMMPEPKDYANWRQQITDLVIASVDGRYQETWTLPSGLTYRVTGRPHPDGAIALLFEDISAEVSLTRRFRWQINLGQSVIDTLDEAIVVFSSTGTLTLSNLAFRELWRLEPDTSFAEFTIRDALLQWKTLATPGPFWDKLRDYLGNPQDRSEWFSDVFLKNGTELECRVVPLSGGATLVGFRLRPMLEGAYQTVGIDRV